MDREANLSPKCRQLQENVLRSKYIYEQHLVTHNAKKYEDFGS